VILKVQKQMRTKPKCGMDRIESCGDVAAVVNELEQADKRSAMVWRTQTEYAQTLGC